MAVRSGYGLGGTNKAFVWHKVSRRLRDWTRSLGNLKLDPSASLHEVIEGEPSIMRRAVSLSSFLSLSVSVSPSLCVHIGSSDQNRVVNRLLEYRSF